MKLTVKGMITSLCLSSAFISSSAWSAEIMLLGYRGVFEDNYRRAVVEPFMKKHPDIKVHYFASNGQAMSLGNLRAQKDAPQANAVILDLSAAKIATDEGLLEKIDLAKVPAYANISDIGKQLGGYAIPITYDTLSLVYSSKGYPTPPDSWNALWDPKHSGKVTVPGQGGGDIQSILLTIIANRMAGEEDYTKSIQPGIDKLVKLAPNVQTWDPKPDAYTLIAGDTVDVAVGYNARSQFYEDQTNGLVRSVVPAEGTAPQINTLAAVANAPEKDATLTFINYALSPEAQAAFAKAMFYAPTNSKTELDEATKKRIPFANSSVREKLIPVDWIEVGKIRDKFIDAWRKQVLPAGR